MSELSIFSFLHENIVESVYENSIFSSYSRVGRPVLSSTELTGVEKNRGGGWKWLDITIIRGWNNRGVLGEIETVVFLRKHVALIYLCEQ